MAGEHEWEAFASRLVREAAPGLPPWGGGLFFPRTTFVTEVRIKNTFNSLHLQPAPFPRIIAPLISRNPFPERTLRDPCHCALRGMACHTAAEIGKGV